MKKIISILILSIFIYNTFGFLVMYPILSGYFKYLGEQRVENVSEDELIETLIFRKEDILNRKIIFQWVNASEFKYNGNMYDIVEKKETEAYLIFHCVNDDKEKELEKNFENKLEENTGNKKQKTARILLKKIISEQICFLVPEKLDFQSLKYKACVSLLYNQIWKEVITPPPQQIV